MKKLAGMVAAVVVIAAVAVMWKGKTRGSEGELEGATRSERIAATSERGEDAEARGEVPAPAEQRLEETGQVAREEVVPEPSAEQLARARWKKQIEAKLEKFEAEPLDLDAVYELARESILAQLDVGFQYEPVREGEAANLVGSTETHVVSRVGPEGSRVYAIPRSQYPRLWELLSYFEPSPVPNPHFPSIHVSQHHSEETEAYARGVLAELSRP